MTHHYSKEEIQEIIEYAKSLGGSFYDSHEGCLMQATPENVIRSLRADEIRHQIAAEREIKLNEVGYLQVERRILNIEAEEERPRRGGIESR